MLIELRWRFWLQYTQAIGPIAREHPVNGCPGDAHVQSDAIHVPAMSSPGNYLSHDLIRCSMGAADALGVVKIFDITRCDRIADSVASSADSSWDRNGEALLPCGSSGLE